MIRACPRSIVFGLLFALLAMSFMIASVSQCEGSGTVQFAQGPFCSVQHASAPIHTEKYTPDMALAQEFASILVAVVVLSLFSKRILDKSLARFAHRIGRIRPVRPIRGETGAYKVFIPQIASAHGM